MPLQAQRSRQGLVIPERTLVFGGPDSGKTHTLLTLAKWHQKLGSDAVFYVIATDLSYDRMLGRGGDFSELENVDYKYVLTMQEFLDAAIKFKKLGRENDWLSVDLLQDAWSAASAEYGERKYGVSLSQAWADQGDPGEYPISGWDYQMPNARYREFMQNNVIRFPGHVLCCTGERRLLGESQSGKTSEREEMQNIFGPIGLKPVGQRDDTFRFHTVLHLDRNGKGEWTIATARDKQRPRLGRVMTNGTMRGVPVNDFFWDYLVEVAGWEADL